MPSPNPYLDSPGLCTLAIHEYCDWSDWPPTPSAWLSSETSLEDSGFEDWRLETVLEKHAQASPPIYLGTLVRLQGSKSLPSWKNPRNLFDSWSLERTAFRHHDQPCYRSIDFGERDQGCRLSFRIQVGSSCMMRAYRRIQPAAGRAAETTSPPHTLLEKAPSDSPVYLWHLRYSALNEEQQSILIELQFKKRYSSYMLQTISPGPTACTFPQSVQSHLPWKCHVKGAMHVGIILTLSFSSPLAKKPRICFHSSPLTSLSPIWQTQV